MPEITKLTNPSLAGTLPPQHLQDHGRAGEALGAWDACYIKSSDRKVYKATGAAANAAAKVAGFVGDIAIPIGEPVTLFHDVVVKYANFTTETLLFLSGTVAGGLADAASTGGTKPIGLVQPGADDATTTTLVRLVGSWRD